MTFVFVMTTALQPYVSLKPTLIGIFPNFEPSFPIYYVRHGETLLMCPLNHQRNLWQLTNQVGQLQSYAITGPPE